jgi:GntR family transcriptional regulator/MocR family aminotransferase
MLQHDFSTIGRHYQNNPIDEQGLDVDYIKTFCKGKFAVFIFNRDYHTVSLTAERRLKLLQLAKEYQFAIMKMIMTMIFSLKVCYLYGSSDANGMVFIGKLGQSLFPSFQTGFVVAPKI